MAYFLDNLATTNITIAINAMTINIPKLIPALKMPSMASQEVNKNKVKNNVIIEMGLIFFMVFFLNVLNNIKGQSAG